MSQTGGPHPPPDSSANVGENVQILIGSTYLRKRHYETQFLRVNFALESVIRQHCLIPAGANDTVTAQISQFA